MNNTLMLIVYLVYIVAGWTSINYLQRRIGLSFIANLHGVMQIFFTKFILANLLGWLAIIIAVIHKLVTR